MHDDKQETSHTFWRQWEGIDDMFALKAAESPFCESITSAFHAVHSYKYIDDPTFPLSMERDLLARGVPADERQKAVKYVQEILEELGKEGVDAEKDAGWNPQLDEIATMTREADTRDAKMTEPFTGGGPAPNEDDLKKAERAGIGGGNKRMKT